MPPIWMFYDRGTKNHVEGDLTQEVTFVLVWGNRGEVEGLLGVTHHFQLNHYGTCSENMTQFETKHIVQMMIR